MALPPQRAGPKGGNGSGNGPTDPVDERHQTEQLADQCGELEENLEQLKARYEMWFLGVDKREPNRDREEIKRRVERIKTAFTRNTGLKFRIQTLAARFLSYERMWLRSAREREAGTYRRDVFKARRHLAERQPGRISESSAPVAKQAGVEPAPGPAAEPPVRPPLVGAGPPAEPPARAAGAVAAGEPPVRPVPAPPPPPRPPVPSQARVSASIGDRQMRALYDAYIEAKRRCNEDVSRLTYDAVARSVQKQVPELMARTKARSVEFKVVIQGGKAVLKAVPHG